MADLRTWEEVREELFTPEEIAESNRRVAEIGKEIDLVVGNCVADLAFEGMVATDEDIARMRRVARGETTAEEEVARILAPYRKGE